MFLRSKNSRSKRLAASSIPHAATEKPIALCTNQTGQYYLLRTLSLSNALRKRNNSAASKFENFCVAEFIRMRFYAVIKLSPLPKNLLQREKIVFIQNDVFKPRRVLRVDLEGELLLTLKEETIGKTVSGVPFLGFLLKPQGIYLSQKKKKRLKKRIKQYRYKLESGEWDEAEYALHITPVLAHVAIGRCRKFCNRIL
ncbi:hypothetical protein C5N99_09015 [Treponema medium]|uniref:hypothetical protein n=1 Tax=Treponema medium TaxID=58231 RepID=UPI001980EF43|nr:hypothetical protein [Treponema medium]QSH92731.1 hypothetical protein C5N99_09015 [Treponema medium]